MKRCTSVLLAGLVTLAMTMTAGADEGPADVVSSRINKVTVYSDRARVTRSADVGLRPGVAIFAFKKLPGWVDDGSVRVALSKGAAGRIVDVRVKRDYLARTTDAEFAKAEAAVQTLAAEAAALNDELKVLDAQAKQIAAIRAFSLEKVSKDTVLGNVAVEGYAKVVGFVSRSLRETAKARREVQARRVKLTPELAARQRKLAELKKLTQLEETAVFVTVEGAGNGAASIELTYMLPGATWEPTHELRSAKARPDSAEVTSFAVVTQATGEDWEGAEIAFATQSSQESIRIPELEALTLGDTATATRIIKSRISSFNRAQQAFQGQNRMWNKLQHRSMTTRHEQMYEQNFHLLQTVQTKTVQIFRSLQNRGTTVHFKGQGRPTVRADGQSVRLRIGKSKLKATQKIVAAPEQSLNAARTLAMVNSTPQPLLPGKVALYQDGAFLGMTDLDFIAEGESFALFLGVADQLKLTRVLDKKHSSIVRRTRTRMKVSYLVTVENLSDAPTTLKLADRVPVSQNREIRIDRVKIEPGVSPDSKGLVHWSLAMAPREKRTFRIAYRIEYPPSLVLRTRRASERRRHPAAPAPAADVRLHEKIKSLESML